MARAEHVRVTRDAVARRAGVSTATVSRVYNAPERVSPGKIQQVRQAAAALGYVPDKSASALRRRGTGRITLLERQGRAAHRDDRIYKWFYSDMIRGIRTALETSMYQLNLATFRTPDDADAFAGPVLGDGVLLHEADETVLARLCRRDVPYVCCGQIEPPAGVQACYTGNRRGGRAAARAFRRTGHKHPAHITGCLASMNVCQLRWEGFCDGFAGTDVRLVDGGPHGLGVRGGRASVGKLIPDIRNGRIDCIFVVNDLTAVGVAYGLLDAGLRIPEDVSIIGYDNLPFLETLPVKLATIDISYEAVYRRATERLLAHLRVPTVIRETIEPVYVPGASVGQR